MAEITLVADVFAPGAATLELDLPKELVVVERPEQHAFAAPRQVEATWKVVVPVRGEYFVQALLRVPQDAPIDKREYASFQSFPLYIELEGNDVRWQGNAPNPKYREPLRTIDRPGFLQKPEALPVPWDHSESNVRITEKRIVQGAVTSYDIYVYIAGRIRYPHGDDACLGGPYNGVPNSKVELDWDYDHDPMTGYTPYFGSDIRHAGYDITSMDGSYYFWFHFISNSPASAYSDIIRVYAGRYNGHAFSGDDVGLDFPNYYYIDIHTATDWIDDGAAHVTVWAPDGGALRYLYRARLFCQADLGWSTATQNRYYIRESQPISFFCGTGNNCGPGTPGPGVPYILFNYVPDADLAYHEQGHFVDWFNQYHIPTGGGSHWFQLPTTQNTAWVEGWAEFYNAAAQLYWAGVEQPAYIEYSNEYYDVYQFLEETQSTLPHGPDRRTVEGAIASFAFNLYDKVWPRHPGYHGDNDNVGAAGNTILSAWNAAEFYSCDILTSNCNNMILEFNNRMKTALGSRWAPSVQAMYNFFLNDASPPYSATAPSLSLTGSDLVRTLTWSDDTSPAAVPYTCYTVTPQRNNESGFRIYRKPGGGPWDGTLTGYTLVNTTGPDVTTWQHALNDRMAQSYVVVAYNVTGESVPLAQAVWPEAPDAAISGPSTLASGAPGNWTGSGSGGTTPYTYRWYTGAFSCAGPWTLRSSTTSLAFSSTSDFCIRLEVQGANGSTGTEQLAVDVYTSGGGGGGCPYLFAYDGHRYVRENTLLQAVDPEDAGQGRSDVVDRYVLRTAVDASAATVRLSIREFEQEHSFIDKVSVVAVDHPAGSRLGVGSDGELVAYGDVVRPVSAIDGEGRDRLSEVMAEDGRVFQGHRGDVLILEYPRGTIGSDSRFGAMVMRKEVDGGGGNAGILAGPKGDPGKSRRRILPREFADLDLIPMEDASRLVTGDFVQVRLEWLAQHDLDFAGVYRVLPLIDVKPLSVRTARLDGRSRQRALASADDKYVELLPGQTLDLVLANTKPGPGARSYVLEVQGHYFRIP